MFLNSNVIKWNGQGTDTTLEFGSLNSILTHWLVLFVRDDDGLLCILQGAIMSILLIIVYSPTADKTTDKLRWVTEISLILCFLISAKAFSSSANALSIYSVLR